MASIMAEFTLIKQLFSYVFSILLKFTNSTKFFNFILSMFVEIEIVLAGAKI